jgi:hypothetical protein
MYLHIDASHVSKLSARKKGPDCGVHKVKWRMTGAFIRSIGPVVG